MVSLIIGKNTAAVGIIMIAEEIIKKTIVVIDHLMIMKESTRDQDILTQTIRTELVVTKEDPTTAILKEVLTNTISVRSTQHHILILPIVSQ